MRCGLARSAICYNSVVSPIHIAAVVFINFVFSGAYIAGKIGVDHFPPFLFTTLRFALVFVALLPFCRIPRGLSPAQKRDFFAFCLAMGIGVYSTMYWALHLADGVSAMLIGTQFATPIAALLGIWLLGDKVSARVWSGILLALFGVLTVGADTALLGYWRAFGLILASAFFYALANILAQKLKGAVNLINLNAWMSLLAVPPMLALSLMTESGHWEVIRAADLRAWGAILYSAFAVSLIGHIGMFALLRRYPAALIMPFYVLTPIFGITGGIAFFDENLTAQFIFGAVVALSGVYIVHHHPRRRPPKKVKKIAQG